MYMLDWFIETQTVVLKHVIFCFLKTVLPAVSNQPETLLVNLTCILEWRKKPSYSSYQLVLESQLWICNSQLHTISPKRVCYNCMIDMTREMINDLLTRKQVWDGSATSPCVVGSIVPSLKLIST